MAKEGNDNTGSNKSGVVNTEYLKQINGVPPEKDKKEIANANSPRSRGKAPGSVRV